MIYFRSVKDMENIVLFYKNNFLLFKVKLKKYKKKKREFIIIVCKGKG